jgi:hypothetical protein
MMFKKIVSNLPFNPSMLNQVSFYAKRLKAENAIRRVGFGLMALALFVQIAAAAFPTKQVTASSTNDVINAGIDTKEQLIAQYNSYGRGVKELYAYFNVGINELNAASFTCNSFYQGCWLQFLHAPTRKRICRKQEHNVSL